MLGVCGGQKRVDTGSPGTTVTDEYEPAYTLLSQPKKSKGFYLLFVCLACFLLSMLD